MTIFFQDIRLYLTSSFGIIGGITIAVLLLAIISYLFGSLNTALIISKFFFHEDIRNKGSGNAGGTNMLRNYGKKIALLSLTFDFFLGKFRFVLLFFLRLGLVFQRNSLANRIGKECHLRFYVNLEYHP